MKLKDGLLLRQVGGQYVIVPTGERVREVTGVHYLTKGAAWLWQQVEGKEFTEEELVDLAQQHFTGVTREKLEQDIHTLLKNMGDNYMLENGKVRGQATVRITQKMYQQVLERMKKENTTSKKSTNEREESV